MNDESTFFESLHFIAAAITRIFTIYFFFVPNKSPSPPTPPVCWTSTTISSPRKKFLFREREIEGAMVDWPKTTISSSMAPLCADGQTCLGLLQVVEDPPLISAGLKPSMTLLFSFFTSTSSGGFPPLLIINYGNDANYHLFNVTAAVGYHSSRC